MPRNFRLGRERLEIGTELLIPGDRIETISKTALECGLVAWDLDAAVTYHSITLASLHGLASNTKTDFRRQLYDALLLYSRSSVTSDIAVKLVFVLVAIESILLKDFNEPIAKNIGEWMAFLVGDALEAKKAVVTNVDRIYKLRSAFIHHGDTIEDVEMVREFLGHAWETFRRLLHRMDRTNTKMSFDSGIRRAQAGLVCYSRTQRRLRMKTSGPGQMLPSDVLVPGPSGLASTQNFTTRSARGRPGRFTDRRRW